MFPTPKVVAFDIIETTMSIEPMRQRLQALGLPPSALEEWFAASLRDAFALACTRTYRPFKDVMDGALAGLLAQRGLKVNEDTRMNALAGMVELTPHDDAIAAFEWLVERDVRIIALSNGAEAATRTLLERAELIDLVERVVSVEAVSMSKPHHSIYEHAATTSGVRITDMMLVACHPWDCHGAKSAGMRAAYVNRRNPFPATMSRPDIEGDSLIDVARKITGSA